MKNQTKKTLSLPFAEVEAKALKAAIVDKFGSLAQFCRITDRSLQILIDRLKHNSATSKQYLAAAFEDAKTRCNQPANGYHLTPILRGRLRAALGGATVVEFCSNHAGFSTVFISRTLNGQTEKITPKVRELAQALNVPLT